MSRPVEDLALKHEDLRLDPCNCKKLCVAVVLDHIWSDWPVSLARSTNSRTARDKKQGGKQLRKLPGVLVTVLLLWRDTMTKAVLMEESI